MRFHILPTALILATVSAVAADKIEGAFGLKLGASFNPDAAIGKAETTSKEPMYQFEPEKPFRSFNRYYVLITPKSKRIYQIWAIGPADNPQACAVEQKVIVTALIEKYGQSEKPGLFDKLSNREAISQGNVLVSVECSAALRGVIEIRYTDLENQKLAEQERIEEEVSKVDKSGL